MIIHKLILQHLAHRDDADFYVLQAADALRWLEKQGVELVPSTRALDLGCGHGTVGAELMKRGCQVTFADEADCLLPHISRASFRRINVDTDDVAALGSYDLVICSNVYEHLAKPELFISSIGKLLNPGGWFYLSWTNWLSPWGGHEFSPFHYLGASCGHRLYDRIVRKPRLHTPFVNLFPTHVGRTLKRLRVQPDLTLMKVAARYYPEFSFVTRIPLLREFLTWNCVVLLRRRA
jgi:2-polyprenyl-3-methyl-5-hydroxy-6-metoxy-1,4-benzoquinol methylase